MIIVKSESMPRRARASFNADYYHVLNRGYMRQQLFDGPIEYRGFLGLLRTDSGAIEVGILAYCLMPNHWHLVLKPTTQPALSAYVGQVTGTHALRWNRSRGRQGAGSVYQGRFKSRPIASEEHLLTVLRYVESNPVRSGLVSRAADWPWSSAAATQDPQAPPLAEWPMAKPLDWDAMLNR